MINGRNIKTYNTTDLHHAMSLLFQNSADLPLSIREFIGVGNIEELENLERIRQAAVESGAVEFIDKLENGFESSFTGEVEAETPDTMYQSAIEWDEMSEDEEGYGDDEEKSDQGDADGETTGPDSKDKMGESGDCDAKVENAKSENEEEKKENEIHESDSRPGRLAFSGGQRQKLVMARSFMRATDLAIFDE